MDKFAIRKHTISLRKIVIRNFKGIDSLLIDFPAPIMRDDLDIMVIGSKNGLGKTSLLEAISLLFLFSTSSFMQLSSILSAFNRINYRDLLIRAGKNQAHIIGEFEVDRNRVVSELFIDRSNGFQYIDSNESTGILSNRPKGADPFKDDFFSSREYGEGVMGSLLGFGHEPLLFPRINYFHSNRKIQEGSMEMVTLFDLDQAELVWEEPRPKVVPTSHFKLEILKALMSRKGLFENVNSEESNNTLSQLNELLKEFAGGIIEKLRSNRDNSLEVRVTPQNGGESFSFDGLSSGQKEIVSTLFLIWQNTKNTPGIVLIDEPELHLNAEWHRKFIRHLHKIAPQNQYIIATHSEDVFASVDENRRLLLVHEVGGERSEG